MLDRSIVPNMIERVRSVDKRFLKLAKDQMFAMNEVLRTGMVIIGEDHLEVLRNLAVTEAQWQRSVLKASVPLEIDFAIPSVELLHTIAEKKFAKQTVTEWFTGLASSTAKKVSDQVLVGIASGEENDKIVTRVKSVSKLMTSQAEAIVRTTANDVSVDTRQRVFEQNTDVIDKVMLVATLDLRTTEICMSYDGQVFPVDEGPRPPFHWNCRTTVVPVTKSWKDLGLDIEVPEGTRASMNGQVPVTQTYGEWLADQPFDDQVEALGQVRAELFRDGKVDIQSFVDDGRLLTLEELKRREGLTDEDIGR